MGAMLSDYPCNPPAMIMTVGCTASHISSTTALSNLCSYYTTDNHQKKLLRARSGEKVQPLVGVAVEELIALGVLGVEARDIWRGEGLCCTLVITPKSRRERVSNQYLLKNEMNENEKCLYYSGGIYRAIKPSLPLNLMGRLSLIITNYLFLVTRRWK
ncbi:hypothetical protein J6590_098080 [Homalodisca vitripennis]|nr:hypothetical protein J6590_098080 [Homalodisca vitripennis]